MGWDKKGQHGTDSWGYWSGSRQQAPWKQDKQNKDKSNNSTAAASKSVLAPYDQTKVGQLGQDSQALVQVISSSGSAGDVGLVKQLQSCVNAARKAETKVKKLCQDKQVRIAQWRQYEQDVKSAFLAERQRHLSTLEQLEVDISKALTAQEDARAKVRAAAQAQGSEDVGMEPPSPEVRDPWADLVAHVDAEPLVDDAAVREVLARAFAASTPDSVPLPLGSVHTPPRRSAPVMTPQARRPGSATLPAMSAPCNSAPAASGTSSRMVPFPAPRPKAPTAVTGHEGQYFIGSPTAAVTDPYGQGYMEEAACLPIPSTSPPLGRPKTPKVRVPIKETAKPAGPLHLTPTSVRHAKMEELRMKASLEAGLLNLPVGPTIVEDDPDPPQLEGGNALTTME